MTKEELEKDAEEFTDTKKSFWRQGRTCIGSVKQAYIAGAEPREKRIAELEEENAELKAKVGLSIDCEKAQKNGELCLGYGGDEDEPCERCKNCIKCEGGYYQLGETEKDEKLTKAKEIIAELIRFQPYIDREAMFHRIGNEWKRAIYEGIQFLKEVSE